jgi:class 3 adenylate cyclase
LKVADCRLNVGVHWGANLYIGQVATEGRLEVTALGDAVNEAARIEQSATGGRVLASKPLLERLSAEDAAALDLDPARLSYELVAELQGVPDKAARDAGSIAVSDVKRPSGGG